MRPVYLIIKRLSRLNPPCQIRVRHPGDANRHSREPPTPHPLDRLRRRDPAIGDHRRVLQKWRVGLQYVVRGPALRGVEEVEIAHDADVRQSELVDLLEQVAERRNRVVQRKAHIVVPAAWVDLEPHIWAPHSTHGFHDLEREPGPILRAATPLVLA
ncbi:unnamed protein product [Mycena citricolor]|uniref:Uncharacterized protein n=1 Tax=Mycena citricolor TaxID=2018698 RepID=A0AAD2HVV1_9AGAR|nr:unnamed protein product [Mycena citricolor]